MHSDLLNACKSKYAPDHEKAGFGASFHRLNLNWYAATKFAMVLGSMAFILKILHFMSDHWS